MGKNKKTKNVKTPVVSNEENAKEQPALKHIAGDAFKSMSHWDNKYPHLIKDLFVKPKVVIDSYFHKDKNYPSPFKYLMIIIAFTLLWNATFNTILKNDFEHYMSITNIKKENITGKNPLIITDYDKATELSKKYSTIFIFLQLPFLSLFSFLLFKKAKYTYASHIIINTYAISQTMVLSVLIYY